MSNVDKRASKLFSIGISIFYLIAIVAILVFGSTWWNNRTTFYLNKKDISMITNETYSIGIYGSTKKDKKNYIFTSSNTSIATVDSNGIVKALSEGEVTINVKSKYSNKIQKVVITVEGDTIYSIDVDQEIYNVKVGDKFTITPVINENSNFYANINYSSSNPSIVTVDTKGNVNARKNGSAYITIKVAGSDLETKVLVNVGQVTNQTNQPTSTPSNPTTTYPNLSDDGGDSEEGSINNNVVVKDVKIYANKENLVVNDTAKCTYVIEPINATDKRVTFSSNNPNVAIVDQKGNIKAVSPGTANISVTTKSGNKTSYVTITVTKGIVPVESISLNKTSTTLENGKSEILSYFINPSSATNQKVTWSSSNTKVVTVNQDGKITAKGIGNATIYVKTLDRNKQAACLVNVVKKSISVKGISLNRKKITLNIGSSSVLTETISPKNATNQNVKWSSSNNNIVSVKNGRIKALKPGNATITVTSVDGNKKDTCNVTVPEIKITKITLKNNSAQVEKGKKYKLNVSITPGNATNKVLKYISSNNSIATVSADGTIIAKNLGQTTITVKTTDNSGKKAKFSIVVVPTGKYIDIRKQKYHKKYYNLNVSEGNTGTAKHMQNFGITDKYIYLSTVSAGCYSANGSVPTEDQKKNLNRTLVFRFSKDNATPAVMNSSKKIKSSLMYLRWSGHGQGFTVDPKTDVIFTPTNVNNNLELIRPNPEYKLGNGRWWGVENGLMQIKFKSNNKDEKISPKQLYKIKNKDGNYIDAKIMASIDKENDLIGLREGYRVRIYRYSQFLKNKYELIYSFKYSSLLGYYPNTNVFISNQGFGIKDGYVYIFRGTPGRSSYVEVFNFLGQQIYHANTKIPVSNYREAEGLQIYGNHIYLGTTHSDAYGNSLMDIGYFK